jgi:hypothetical protein
MARHHASGSNPVAKKGVTVKHRLAWLHWNKDGDGHISRGTTPQVLRAKPNR